MLLFKQKTAYVLRISDWSSDVCSSDLTGRKLKVKNIEHFDFTGWDIALFSAGSGPTKIYAPKAAEAGCVVIDNSSLYRMDPDVPLIVPEVHPAAIDEYKKRNIIANPNCSTAQLVVALTPLHDYAKIKRGALGREHVRNTVTNEKLRCSGL